MMRYLKTAPWIVKILFVLVVLGALLWVEGVLMKLLMQFGQ